MSSVKEKNKRRAKRRRRVRGGLSGTAERPRLSVFRSLVHIYCQIIDDRSGRTLTCASSREPGLRSELRHGGNTTAAKKIGQMIAARAKEKGISAVLFDRGSYRYHGRVKALAEAAREGGLKF
jgi:large subunit ribosomal protein L18